MLPIYLLDSGPLGLLAHSRLANRRALEARLVDEVAAGATVDLSEVADYEARRELTRLILAGQLPTTRLARLDQIATLFTYLPLATAIWRQAAAFWAEARSKG